MTDRVKALTVLLDRDVREDDVQSLAEAIQCLRGVQSVVNIKVVSDDLLNRERIRRELIEQVYRVLRGDS